MSKSVGAINCLLAFSIYLDILIPSFYTCLIVTVAYAKSAGCFADYSNLDLALNSFLFQLQLKVNCNIFREEGHLSFNLINLHSKLLILLLQNAIDAWLHVFNNIRGTRKFSGRLGHKE